MRRSMCLIWIAGLLLLTAAPALAQEKDEVPPDGGGSTEPAPAYYVDISVSEVEGSPAGQVPVGEPTKVTLHATNTSAETARDVTVEIEPTPGTTISPTTVSFGDLDGEGGTADRAVTVEVAEGNCQDYTGWGATLRSSLGEQALKFGVSVLCPGPRLAQEQVEYVGGDGDNVPEPGETLKVFVTYRNNGRDPATEVRATARTTSAGVTISDATASWGTIAPGDAVRASDPFVIEIAADATTQESSCSWDGGGMVVEDGDATVSSDGSEPEPAGDPEPADGGGSSGSSGAATTTSEPERAEDDPISPEERRRGEEAAQDPAVVVTGEMAVTAAEVTFEDTFSNQMFCTMMESQRGGPAAGAPGDDRTAGGAADVDGRDLLAGTANAGSGDAGRAEMIAIAALLLAMVASQVGWRLRLARASSDGS